MASSIRALKAVQLQLSRLAEGADSLPLEAQRERVRQARDMLTSVKPEGPDLAALMASDPVLARAYELTPACTPGASPPASPSPTGDAPLPTAADGSDVSACLDGSCEISISAPAEIVVGGIRISLTKVAEGKVTLRQDSSRGGYSEATTNANGMVSLNGVGIRVVAVNGGTALLRIAVP